MVIGYGIIKIIVRLSETKNISLKIMSLSVKTTYFYFTLRKYPFCKLLYITCSRSSFIQKLVLKKSALQTKGVTTNDTLKCSVPDYFIRRHADLAGFGISCHLETYAQQYRIKVISLGIGPMPHPGRVCARLYLEDLNKFCQK